MSKTFSEMVLVSTITPNVTYEEYITVLESIETGTISEFSLSGALKKIKDFIYDIISTVKVKAQDVISLFKNKNVFKFFKYFKFSFKGIYNLTQKGYKLAKELKHHVGDFLTDLNKDKALQFDDWIKEKKVLKKLAGIGIAGLLAYIWFNMAFTGEHEYDFDMTDMLKALKGNFSVEELFTGHNGVKLLTLFGAGKLLNVSWPCPGDSSTQFTSAVIISLVGIVLGKVQQRMTESIIEDTIQVNKFDKLVQESMSQAMQSAYEKDKVPGKTCDCGYVFPKYKGRYGKCPQCAEGKTTTAMTSAMSKTIKKKSSCNTCGFDIPSYKGRYPKYCPECGENMTY